MARGIVVDVSGEGMADPSKYTADPVSHGQVRQTGAFLFLCCGKFAGDQSAMLLEWRE
ncbi:MAG: hypothetical protein M1399_00900 [Actinobacteria bacterium]|nr:hypothetical protein [Actinomycetota bacterium]